jgi:hypothetical protein
MARSDMPSLLRNVRSQGQSGKHLLGLSFSGFDPERTSIAGPQLYPAIYATAATGLHTSKNAAAATIQRASRNQERQAQ